MPMSTNFMQNPLKKKVIQTLRIFEQQKRFCNPNNKYFEKKAFNSLEPSRKLTEYYVLQAKMKITKELRAIKRRHTNSP
jgi:hypothetical protein